MSQQLPIDNQNIEMPEQERARIRAEMRYAMLVTQEVPQSEKPKSAIDKLLGYLSNGFVLLILGSLITSFLVPIFQRQYEARKQQGALMHACLGQFLLYTNSIWQEYYVILPLTQEEEIDKEEYLRYEKEIAQIKLKRYDAYANVQALAVVFRDTGNGKTEPVEAALERYAVSLNNASTAIDKWLRGLYCTPTMREQSPCANFDPTFDAYTEYGKIQKLVFEIGNKESDDVAALMVNKISHGN